jgi:hypothetical protein
MTDAMTSENTDLSSRDTRYMGFGLVTGFGEHLQNVTARNYSAIA